MYIHAQLLRTNWSVYQLARTATSHTDSFPRCAPCASVRQHNLLAILTNLSCVQCDTTNRHPPRLRFEDPSADRTILPSRSESNRTPLRTSLHAARLPAASCPRLPTLSVTNFERRMIRRH